MRQKASEGTLNVKDALQFLTHEQDSMPYWKYNKYGVYPARCSCEGSALPVRCTECDWHPLSFAVIWLNMKTNSLGMMFALGTTYHSVPLRSPANISEVLVHILEESVCSSVRISLLICFSASPLLFFFSFHFHCIVSTLSPATNIRGMKGDVNYPISGSLLIVCCNLNKSVHAWLQQQQEEEIDMQVPPPSLWGFSTQTQACTAHCYKGLHLAESQMQKKESLLSLEINN